MRICSLLVGAGLLVGGSMASAGLITAEFTGGNGTASVDQFKGTAGGGWAAGWGQQNGSGNETGIVSTVVNTSPLRTGSGNYLSVTNNWSNATTIGSPATQGNSSIAVRRQYTTYGPVNLAQPYSIEFDLRLDSSLTTFNSITDYLRLTDRNSGGNDSLSSSTYIITALGANDGNALAKQWAWYNGNKDNGSFSNTRYVDSGLALTAGTVYHFIINQDPTTKTYTASISDGTTTVTTPYAMGWRTSNATGGVLHFVSRQDNYLDATTFSLDNVVVPEPGALSLLALGGLVGLRRRSA